MHAAEPVADVEVVDVLLDDVIAAEPVEVVPVAHLVFHFGLAGLADADPEAGAVPVDAGEEDVADLAVLDAGDGFLIARIVMPLQADGDHQVLLLRLFVGGEHAADAGPVDGDRLLHEDVLAGFDGGFEVQRAEAGRRGQDHQVDAAVDRLLVGVEADELALGRARRCLSFRRTAACLRRGRLSTPR